jgi:hypothetical protein
LELFIKYCIVILQNPTAKKGREGGRETERRREEGKKEGKLSPITLSSNLSVLLCKNK